MTVTGGPGDATGSNPYVVTFGGALAGADQPELSIDRTRLARPGRLAAVMQGNVGSR